MIVLRHVAVLVDERIAMTDAAFLRLVRAVTAVLLGIAWAIAIAVGVIFSFKSATDPEWLTSDGLTYFMPGLTALVGGVVAAAFGVPRPETDSPPGPTDRLSNVVEGKPVSDSVTRQWVGRAYIVIYLFCGAAAALTWVVKGGDTVTFVKTLAPAWAGLALPIGASFFTEPRGS